MAVSINLVVAIASISPQLGPKGFSQRVSKVGLWTIITNVTQQRLRSI